MVSIWMGCSGGYSGKYNAALKISFGKLTKDLFVKEAHSPWQKDALECITAFTQDNVLNLAGLSSKNKQLFMGNFNNQRITFYFSRKSLLLSP